MDWSKFTDLMMFDNQQWLLHFCTRRDITLGAGCESGSMFGVGEKEPLGRES